MCLRRAYRTRWSNSPRALILAPATRAVAARCFYAACCFEERERPVIKCLDVLIDGRVGAVLEDVQLSILDVPNQRVCEARRREKLEAAEGDQRWAVIRVSCASAS